ncbi:MAG: hypothetical protein Q8922_09435 [Bacteroidota bacterium]|nr:hypothetical protein [Bacteroidota bacterium]MDP4234414.1 hypothetical protein [Bacteroidota bacterium]MDP4243980.1 hypothetical protein [Bacteroidota bacterium]MDP4288146.1 hypothetical protein [Bacteroidota bacterium]
MKAEKYNIYVESADGTSTKVRYGFGAAGEEVQRILDVPGTVRIRVQIEGEKPDVTFETTRAWRLLDIKQRIKALSFEQ